VRPGAGARLPARQLPLPDHLRQAMIAIRGLKKRLGRKQVLDGVDLDIEKGETVVVLGPSGTGKSVLLKHIIGLMKPDAGSIQVDGDEVVGMGEPELNRVRRKFGMLF